MLNKKLKQVRVVKNKFYLYKGKLVRVISFHAKENRVVIYNYEENKKVHIEYDTAHLFLVPLFRIGEVAKFLQRSPETLRRYETSGLLGRAKKYKTGKNFLRLYNEDELMDLADFFSQRNPPGRPEKTNSKIDRTHLYKSLESRIKEMK